MYHQMLGFNPDECDINGGKLSPEDCMRYAKEYAEKFYPNQEVVFALHNEYCKEDKTHRYAVHMVINRSDLSNGKRLAEGLSLSLIHIWRRAMSSWGRSSESPVFCFPRCAT